MPVSNNNIAQYLNEDGEVIIGNEIVSFKDIDSYNDLEKLGKTPPREVSNPLRATYGKEDLYGNDIDNDNCSPVHSPRNDRKMWVKSRLKDGQIHIEVSFRKKGLFGKWYNYKSYGHINGHIYYTLSPGALHLSGQPNQTWDVDYFREQNASSSHDYYHRPNKGWYIRSPKVAFSVMLNFMNEPYYYRTSGMNQYGTNIN